MQTSTANTQHDRGSPVPAQVTPELLETVARALVAALVPPPRQPAPPGTGQAPDFLTAAQLAARLGVSRETVRRLAIAGALSHTVVCRGIRKTSPHLPHPAAPIGPSLAHMTPADRAEVVAILSRLGDTRDGPFILARCRLPGCWPGVSRQARARACAAAARTLAWSKR
jgi:excisionase family DNA binding protein